MNAFPKTALAMAALSFSALAAAQITFYERESFQGRSFVTQGQIDSISEYGFNDRASSVVVQGGNWEVCEDVRFGGRCVVLIPGQYPSLSSMSLDNRITSVRATNAGPGNYGNRNPAGNPSAQITFYEGENYSGRSYSTQQQLETFRGTGFNNRASSVVVVGNRWEVCEDPSFAGRCVILLEGSYPSLALTGLNDRISSVRYTESNTREERRANRDYRRRANERMYEANVTSARAVAGTPEQRCWMEREQVAPQQRSGASMPGAIVGAVIGGIIGHQFGSGRGQDIATAGGAVAGGVVGSKVGRGTQEAQFQDVQRCKDVQSQVPAYWDVTYTFRGQDHRVQMTSQPGATVQVNEQGEPRS